MHIWKYEQRSYTKCINKKGTECTRFTENTIFEFLSLQYFLNAFYVSIVFQFSLYISCMQDSFYYNKFFMSWISLLIEAKWYLSKYLLKCSLIKHTWLWRDKFHVLWTLDIKANLFLCIRLIFFQVKHMSYLISFHATTS